MTVPTSESAKDLTTYLIAALNWVVMSSHSSADKREIRKQRKEVNALLAQGADPKMEIEGWSPLSLVERYSRDNQKHPCLDLIAAAVKAREPPHSAPHLPDRSKKSVKPSARRRQPG